MSRIGEAAAAANRVPAADVFHGEVDASRSQQDVLRGLDGKQVCPFCGSVSEKTGAPCARCGMDNTPEARKATKARIGPWYVLQARNPAAPGMRFETLLSFVRKGRVRARSVVRGPTTHQLWRFAAHVKGLSREFGLCFSCGSAVEATSNICPQCNRLQEPPLNPDVLLEDGSDEAAASAAGRAPIYRELPEPGSGPAGPAAPEPAPPEDVDIIIPALGGLGPDDLDSTFSESRVAETSSTAPPPAATTRVAPAAFDVPSPTTPRPSVAQPSHAHAPAAEPAPVSQPQPPRRPAPVAKEPINPFAIPPAAPRKKSSADAAFLSAKDLAAAFKLSFDPSVNLDAVEIPDQMPAGAMPPANAIVPRGGVQQQQPSQQTALARLDTFDPHARRAPGGAWRAVRKFVLFLLIFAATGFAVLMWVDPAARDKTVAYTRQTFTRLHSYATGADTRPPVNPAADDGLLEASKIPDPPAPAPAPPPREPEVPSSLGADESPPTVREKAPAEKPAPKPDDADEPAVAEASPTDPDPQPAETTETDAEIEAKIDELWKTGIQAGTDYAAAVKAFEAIKKYPKDKWRFGLEKKLESAKQQLARQQAKKPAK